MSAALDMTSDEYHADETGDTPTLNASIARILCTRTPAHAWAAHPKLNPEWQRREDDKFDVGNVVHSLLLQGIDIVHRVDANDWRTKDAKLERDSARGRGKIPLLERQWSEVAAMLDAVRAQVASLPLTPPPFTDGQPEQTLVWSEHGVRCRARLDWLHHDGLTVDDLKTTTASAEPAAWARTLYGMGADIQAAFYTRAVQAVYGHTVVDFRWVVAECAPPYAVSVINLAPSAMALANEKVDHALAVWRRCLATDTWPGYPPQVASVEAPGYEESRWLERQAMAEATTTRAVLDGDIGMAERRYETWLETLKDHGP